MTGTVPEPAVPPGGEGVEPVLVQRDIVVIGASAGGVEALGRIVRELPNELAASLFVVLHVLPSGTSMLPQVLARAGRLPATAAVDGDRFERGQIYVAPPDWHMLIGDGELRLARGPRENGHRPAIDPLFRSAARVYAERVVGVILTGSLDDGAAGLRFVKERGGTTVVQDPSDAIYPGMPSSAIEATDVDHVVALARMPELICGLIDIPVERSEPSTDLAAMEPDSVEIAPHDPATGAGQPPGLTCPECGGALREEHSSRLVRFTCQVGHAYSADSLVTEQAAQLEMTLWAAIRSLEERVDLLRRMARRTSLAHTRHSFESRASLAKSEAELLRRTIKNLGRGAPEPGDLQRDR